MEKMTLARALKEKNRIARKLQEYRSVFAEVNSVEVGIKPQMDPAECYQELCKYQRQFVSLKRAIAAANAEISEVLAEMLVMNGEIEYLKGLNCTEEALRDDRYGDSAHSRQVLKYNVLINGKRRRELLDALEMRLNGLQDQADQYNATHMVEVDLS